MEFLFKNRNKVNLHNCVYFIKNLKNSKIYVGSTINLKKRIIDHYNLLKNNKHHNRKLQNSWNKHGEINFIFLVVEENIEINNLLDREQYYINKYKTNQSNPTKITNRTEDYLSSVRLINLI